MRLFPFAVLTLAVLACSRATSTAGGPAPAPAAVQPAPGQQPPGRARAIPVAPPRDRAPTPR